MGITLTVEQAVERKFHKNREVTIELTPEVAARYKLDSEEVWVIDSWVDLTHLEKQDFSPDGMLFYRLRGRAKYRTELTGARVYVRPAGKEKPITTIVLLRNMLVKVQDTNSEIDPKKA